MIIQISKHAIVSWARYDCWCVVCC